jgi:hypothetical protein
MPAQPGNPEANTRPPTPASAMKSRLLYRCSSMLTSRCGDGSVLPKGKTRVSRDLFPE